MFVGLVSGCSGTVAGSVDTSQLQQSESATVREPIPARRHGLYNHVPSAQERISKAGPRLAPDAPISTAGTGTPSIKYNGGPMIESVEVYAVFWGPNVNPEVVAGVPGFFAAETMSPLMSQLNTEYNAGTNFKLGTGSFKAAVTDTDAPMPPAGSSLFDSDIRAEIGRLIDLGKLPANNGHNIYMMYFPPNLTIDQGGGQTSCQVFCGYHNYFPRNGSNAFYAIMPDHYSNGCDQYCGPETAHLDNLYRTSSHELTEAITDPVVGQGWYDQTWDENGDMCVDWDGNTSGYAVQSEWSPPVKGCRDHAPAQSSGATLAITGGAVGVPGGNVVFTISSTGTGTGSVTLEAQEIDLSAATGFNGKFSTPTIPINGGSGTLTLAIPTGAASRIYPFHLGFYDADGAHYYQAVNVLYKGAPPVITAANPATGPTQGSVIELDGTGLSSNATAFVCATSKCSVATRIPATGHYVSGSGHTKFSVELPSHAAGKVTIGLLNPNDTTLAKTTFTYVAGAAPTVSKVDPPSGPIAGGTYIYVTGTNFGSNIAVTMGGTAMVANQTFARFDAQTILVVSPAASAGNATIVVTNADGKSASGTFKYGVNSPPEIDHLSLTTGPTAGGQYVTVFGQGFDATPTAALDNVAAKMETLSDGFISIITPPHAAGMVNLVVTNSDGQTSSTPYTYSDATGTDDGGASSDGGTDDGGADMAGGGGGGGGGSGGGVGGNGPGGSTPPGGTNAIKSSGCTIGGDGTSAFGSLLLVLACLGLALRRRRA